MGLRSEAGLIAPKPYKETGNNDEKTEIKAMVIYNASASFDSDRSDIPHCIYGIYFNDEYEYVSLE